VLNFQTNAATITTFTFVYPSIFSRVTLRPSTESQHFQILAENILFLWNIDEIYSVHWRSIENVLNKLSLHLLTYLRTYFLLVRPGPQRWTWGKIAGVWFLEARCFSCCWTSMIKALKINAGLSSGYWLFFSWWFLCLIWMQCCFNVWIVDASIHHRHVHLSQPVS